MQLSLLLLHLTFCHALLPFENSFRSAFESLQDALKPFSLQESQTPRPPKPVYVETYDHNDRRIVGKECREIPDKKCSLVKEKQCDKVVKEVCADTVVDDCQVVAQSSPSRICRQESRRRCHFEISPVCSKKVDCKIVNENICTNDQVEKECRKVPVEEKNEGM